MKKKLKQKRTMSLLVVTAMALMFAGCTGPSNGGTTASTLETKKITIAGSTTVQPISNQAVEAYTALNPNVKISVQGGGSGTGVRMASEGSVDIGASSRDLKDSEIAATPTLIAHTIAYDGIAVVLHPENNIDDLTLKQVQDIFAGKINNFNEVGGPDKEIVVVIREEGSGTRATFEELVMDDGTVANCESSLQKPSNGAVRATVAGNENAIAYVGLGYVDESVKAISVDGVAPTTASIGDGSYPISRGLYYITDGEPKDEVKKFIDYVMGSEGQTIVEKEGFIPLN